MTTKTIFLDVGGHRGETLEAVLSPKYHFDLVHCFEPIPELCDYIETAFAVYLDNKLQVHNFGLADFTGDQNLYGTGPQEKYGDGLGASLFADKEDIDSSHFIRCRFMAASEFIDKHIAGDDFVVLKMNCEGGEALILRDLMQSGKIHSINYMMIDFDIRKIPSRRAEQKKIVDELAGIGYTDYIVAREIGRTLHVSDTTAIWLSMMPHAEKIMNMSIYEFIRAKILRAMPKKLRRWVMRRRRKIYQLLGLIRTV